MSSEMQLETAPHSQLDDHELLVNCLDALDREATVWALPTVAMGDRIDVVLEDYPVKGKIYKAVLSGILWLKDEGKINSDYTMTRGDVADLLCRTHPDAEVIYPASWPTRPLV